MLDTVKPHLQVLPTMQVLWQDSISEYLCSLHGMYISKGVEELAVI